MCDGCGSGDCGFIGGAGGPAYNNGFNTIGIGDVVTPGQHGFGSGDVFYGKKKNRKNITNIATKKAAPTFDDFSSPVQGGFGQGDLPLIVPSKPKK